MKPRNAEIVAPDGHPEWITVFELARLARVSPSTLRRWARQGIGPSPVRVGPRLVRYRRSEVEEWMTGRQARP